MRLSGPRAEKHLWEDAKCNQAGECLNTCAGLFVQPVKPNEVKAIQILKPKWPVKITSMMPILKHLNHSIKVSNAYADLTVNTKHQVISVTSMTQI